MITRSAFYLLLAGLVLPGCGNKLPNTKEEANSETEKPAMSSGSAEVATAPIDSINSEYLEWSTATLNGRVPMLSTAKAAFRELGQPDSLITPNMDDICVSYFDQNFQFAYIKNTQLEIKGDTAVISTIDFRRQHKLTLQTPSIRLSRNTTLEDLALMYPQAVKKQSEMNVHNLGKVMSVYLPTSRISLDDGWLLFFQNGRLVRIDYWMPC